MEYEGLPITLLAMIRHGPTEWNAAGRVQGRTDVPLSDAGRVWLASWQLPLDLKDLRWFTSPLARARETAALLGIDAEVEPCLVEMDWGVWEAHVLSDLRQREREAMRVRQEMGALFRAPGGESPRDVQLRLAPWLSRLGREGRPSGAIAHKGIIRAIYALAIDWDMRIPPPDPLEDGRAHLFQLEADGSPGIERLNIPLTHLPRP